MVAQYLNRHVDASSQACAERCVLTNVINVNTFGVTNNDTLTYSGVRKASLFREVVRRDFVFESGRHTLLTAARNR